MDKHASHNLLNRADNVNRLNPLPHIRSLGYALRPSLFRVLLRQLNVSSIIAKENVSTLHEIGGNRFKCCGFASIKVLSEH